MLAIAEAVSGRHRSTAGDWLGPPLRALDRMLRRRMAIGEFCPEPRCIIRIRVVRADRDICLADQTPIRKGDPIGELHLWNEHLPFVSEFESGLAWALEMRRLFGFSFMCLAASLESDPRFQSVQAFRGSMTFANGIHRTAKLKHVMDWYGIEILPDRPRSLLWLRDFGNAVFTSALICAFHPGGSFGGWRLQRRQYELWLSRRVLCERYRRADAAELFRAGKGLAKRKDAA